MSNKVLYDNFVKDWCNIRCNNLTVDGTFTHNGGGGGNSPVSVNTYAELKTAVTAATKYISVDTALIADSNLDIPQTTFIKIVLNEDLSFGDHSIDFGNNQTALILCSETQTNLINVTYAPLTEHALCINDASGAKLKMYGLITNNLGGLANCPIANSASLEFDNCDITAISYVGNNGLSFTTKGYCNNCLFNNTELFINAGNVNILNCLFNGGNQIINVVGVESSGSKIIGCTFEATTGQVNVDVATVDFILCNNYKTAGVTVTAAGSTVKAGNNFP